MVRHARVSRKEGENGKKKMNVTGNCRRRRFDRYRYLNDPYAYRDIMCHHKLSSKKSRVQCNKSKQGYDKRSCPQPLMTENEWVSWSLESLIRDVVGAHWWGDLGLWKSGVVG